MKKLLLALVMFSCVVGRAQLQVGFSFRATQSYVTDLPNTTGVLPATAYPSSFQGTTFGWAVPNSAWGRDRNSANDPRLAGVNLGQSGTPASFYVDLAPGAYTITLALGDAGYQQCWIGCQVQFLDGATILATISAHNIAQQSFQDMKGSVWTAATWPGSNQTMDVTLTGSRLTVLVGSSVADGTQTPIAFFGISQVASGSFGFTPNIVVAAGQHGNITLNFSIANGFNSAIALSLSPLPSGITATLTPPTIPAPGNGASVLGVDVAANVVPGQYEITVQGQGQGVKQSIVVSVVVSGSK